MAYHIKTRDATNSDGSFSEIAFVNEYVSPIEGETHLTFRVEHVRDGISTLTVTEQTTGSLKKRRRMTIDAVLSTFARKELIRVLSREPE